MAKKEEYKATKTEHVASQTNQWIGKNAKILIGVGVGVIVVLLALLIVLSVVDNKKERSFEALLVLETSYSKLEEVGDDQFITECQALISDNGLSSYPGAKAALYLADVSYDNGDYSTALDWYNKVAEAQSKTYLYQVAMMNSAAANEMLDNTGAALDIYNTLWESFGKNGLYGSRALFNAARLYEAQGNKELAKATYEQLVGEYEPLQSEYAALAKTRLAQLN